MLRIFFASLVLTLAACSRPAETTSQTPAAEEASVTLAVSMPAAGARVTSPLRVEGTAPGDWFFEAVFPLELRGADNALIAEAPARAQAQWMTERPVPFVGELQFQVSQETQAVLVLQEDMPGDEAHPREVRVPVVLAPLP
ncbi:MAG: hypothetical protein JNJ63_01940 [Hyphomonadaceae bacterium]|nr:hypothetical protein [Hyphomonadaceae bacterium]